MNKKQINKLYAGLKPAELANLALDAIVRCDESELDAILTAVPRKSYTCPHVDYLNRFHDLEMLVFQYALAHWEATSKFYLSLAVCAVGNTPKDTSISEMWNSELKAIDIALETVCKKVGADALTIRKWARCPAQCRAGVADAPVEAELVEQYVRLFSLAVDRTHNDYQPVQTTGNSDLSALSDEELLGQLKAVSERLESTGKLG
jgi:hypothetical protein